MDFDAIVIPGGHAPEKMRMRHAMVDLVRDAMDAGKPVAAICHGPQLLISANAVRGRTITCWPSIAIDVKNAGGLYVDKPVVVDGPVITSRKPDDIPFFSDAVIGALARYLMVSRQNLSGLIGRMARDGHVAVGTHGQDRRSRVVTMTKSGRRVV